MPAPSVRSILSTLCPVAVLCTATLASAAEPRIAIVDIQKVLASVDDAKSAKQKLKGALDAKQKVLNAKQEELKKLKDEYESQRLLMTAERRTSMEQQLQQGLIELQSFMMENQKDLAQAEAKATNEILQKVQAIVNQMAEKAGWQLVLVDSGDDVLFAAPELDITNEVIRRYNAGK